MGAIADAFKAAFPLYVVDGAASSGVAPASKQNAYALGKVIEAAVTDSASPGSLQDQINTLDIEVAALAAAALLAAVKYATAAAMNADHTQANLAFGYVYADGANNGLYYYTVSGTAWHAIADPSTVALAAEIARAEAAEAETNAYIATVLNDVTTVTDGGMTVALTASAMSTAPYGGADPGISGVAEEVTVAGLPAGGFNGIRLTAGLARPAGLDPAHRAVAYYAVLKTGAAGSFGNVSGWSNIALGAVATKVDPELEVVPAGTIIPIYTPGGAIFNPATLAAAFTGVSAEIGIYALAADGSPAHIGQPFGTMPNLPASPQSYYITTQNPQTHYWQLSSPNTRFGFDLVVLSGAAAVGRKASANATLVDELKSLLVGADYAMAIPPKIYGLSTNFDFYWENCTPDRASRYEYDFSSGSLSAIPQVDDGLRWRGSGTFMNGGAGYSATISQIRPRDGAVLGAAQTPLMFFPDPTTAGAAKVIPLGDSTTATPWDLTSAGNQLAGDPMSMSYVGSRSITLAAGTFSGVTGLASLPVIGDVYTDGTGNYWEMLIGNAINGGAGSVRMQSQVGNPVGAPPASGTLSRHSGTGPSTIAYTSFVGGVQTIEHEAWAGYRGDEFGAGPGRTWYQCTGVTGLTVDPVANDPPWTGTNNGSTWIVRRTNLTGHAGSITVERSAGTNPLDTATPLVRTSGTGDASIAFTGVTTTWSNPFWTGSALDLEAYRSANGLPTDFTEFRDKLGVNDIATLDTDDAVLAQIVTSFAALDARIAMVAAYNAAQSKAVKYMLYPPDAPSASPQAFGVSYGNIIKWWRYKRNYWLYVSALLATYKATANVYIVPTYAAADPKNNVALAAPAALNAGNAALLGSAFNNGVHGNSTTGYQRAQADIAFHKALFS